MTNHDELCDSIRAIVRNCMKEPWSTRTDTNRTFDDICNGGTEAILKLVKSKLSGSCEGMTVEAIEAEIKPYVMTLYRDNKWINTVAKAVHSFIHAQMTGGKK